jgi:lysylphosphatidylglycerol synthetase-like protein (DUF2156 family)
LSSSSLLLQMLYITLRTPYIKKMVAGVFVYPHLFSTQKTNVSDLLTSDSPTRFLNRLVSVLVAVATLPLWEGLFRHTDLSPSREKIKWVAVAPPTVKRACVCTVRTNTQGYLTPSTQKCLGWLALYSYPNL